MTTYDNFIDSYAVELKEAISDFKKLDVDSITEEDLNNAYARVNNIYDVGVADKLESFLHNKKQLCIREIADMGLNNMNRYGTEMRQALNALEDYTNYLRKYLPEEEDD
jgi:hypothetical protein